ncbi:hypothetical protein [Streptacidiphilus cavernicola]|uniref:Cysteine-rich CPCC domain-containing protein n=1 Tax=Streptacidiphilus cavernicola TaxID=3342716 RepID=A0ABV6VR75_9ACTN
MDGQGRGIYVCQDCGSHYLPPVGMSYPCGPASEIFCAWCQPDNSPALASQAGVNIADNLVERRRRGPGRAGHAPAKQGRGGRGKLG